MYNFNQLINNYKIEIPMIQRDYAQGRKSYKVNKIRKEFLDSIDEKLEKNEPMHLDFVYGTIKDDCFIPLDGQQRLTTLFLLYWYFGKKENKDIENQENQENQENEIIDNEIIDLRKFTYETRSSSREFCNKLIDCKIDFSGIVFSEQIKDSNWFLPFWENDPTIKSMFVMIDAIHEKFKNKQYFDSLNNISFEFFELEKFKLDEELYIKMNARGKELTPFEIFKAGFTNYLKDTATKSKMDNAWLDIFWSRNTTNTDEVHPKNIDIEFYNFFENIVLNLYVETNSIDTEFMAEYKLFEYYKEVLSNQNNIDIIIKTLDALTTFEDSENIFNKFVQTYEKIDYWERVRFHALMQYFINVNGVNDEDKIVFSHWMRITQNLINNTLIQSPKDYQNAIRSITKLADNINDMYSFIKDENNKIDFFSGEQRKEEGLKVKLMIANNDWGNLIIKIEKHSYFDGQIGFILEYSKNSEDSNYDKEIFKSYSDKLSVLFSEEFQENRRLFQRALLSKGDYLVDIKSNKTFCNFEEALRTKNDNWRKVFNDKDKTLFLQNLLDDINNENIDSELKAIIKNSKVTDWKQFFIGEPENLNSCDKFQIRFENNNIYLLSKLIMRSWHSELFTFNLYQSKLENESINGYKFKYNGSKSSEQPSIICSKNDSNLDIIFNENGKFQVDEKELQINPIKNDEDDYDYIDVAFEEIKKYLTK